MWNWGKRVRDARLRFPVDSDTMVTKIFAGALLCLVAGGIGFFGLRAFASGGAEPLAVGAAIPALQVELQDGRSLSLKEAAAKGFTLVYFYPKADTPGCTAQACSLRDAYTALQERGVRIFGVSRDKREAQAAFKEKYHLPFDLVADPKGELIAAFGVPTMPAVGVPKRQAYLFKDGVLVWRDLSASTKEQAEDVLKRLDLLESAIDRGG